MTNTGGIFRSQNQSLLPIPALETVPFSDSAPPRQRSMWVEDMFAFFVGIEQPPFMNLFPGRESCDEVFLCTVFL